MEEQKEIVTEASKNLLEEDIEELMKRKHLARQNFGVSSHSRRKSFSREKEYQAQCQNLLYIQQ